MDKRAILMVKADAYGHGLVEVALAAQDIVDAFGVATLEEGLALKSAGIKKEILALVVAADEMEEAFERGLSVGLHSAAQLDMLERLVKRGRIDPKQANLHIKVDTGMHRLGFAPDRVTEIAARLSEIGVVPKGIYSHLRGRVYSQKTEFMHAIEQVKALFPQIPAHLAASENLDVRTLRFDAVRLGIAAYRGAMTVESEVVESRKIGAGEHVSYGNFAVRDDANTAVVFGGYADGVRRERPSFVEIRGKRCPVLGRVCMDMFVVDTGDFLAEEGEKVTLLSPDIADDVAKERGTIPYTVMTDWRGRLERRYIYDKGAGEKNGA